MWAVRCDVGCAVCEVWDVLYVRCGEGCAVCEVWCEMCRV